MLANADQLLCPGSCSSNPRESQGRDVVSQSDDLPIDLRGIDPNWEVIRAPEQLPAWQGVVEVCRLVARDMSVLVEHVVGSIESEIPDYRERAAVSDDDLRLSVRGNITMMLLAIAEHRLPTADELAVRAEVGHRRAAQGVGVDALLHSYHVMYREVWSALVRETTALHPDQVGLLAAATTVWTWMDTVTQAVAAAHRQTTRGQQSLVAAMGQRFVDFLVSGDLESEALADLTRLIGFDSAGDFQMVSIRDHLLDPAETVRLESMVALRSHGRCRCIARGTDVVVLVQGVGADEVEKWLQEFLPTAAVGVGLVRSGLEGARLSLGDAERALALSARLDRTSRFGEDWVQATVLHAWDRVHPLLESGVKVAAQSPHLAETIHCFAESGFSVAETARRLTVHPNTVAYRLERWRKLTSWNPRSFAGLAASMAALELGATGGPVHSTTQTGRGS